MALFKRPSYQLNYEVRSETTPVDVLFLHGNIASNRWWYPVAEQIEQSYRQEGPQGGHMFFIELPGCGASSELPAGFQLHVDDMVNDVLAFVKEQGLKKPVLVGHSTGGLISTLLMAREPELFRGALLVDSVGPKGIVFPDDLFEKYDQMAKSRELCAQIIGATIHGNDFQSEFFNNVIVEDTLASLNKCGTQIIRALRGIDVSHEIAKVRLPVALFHGTHDWVLEEAHSLDLHNLIPNSTFTKLPENGHCLNMENPKKLAEEMKKFLAQFSVGKSTQATTSI